MMIEVNPILRGRRPTGEDCGRLWHPNERERRQAPRTNQASADSERLKFMDVVVDYCENIYPTLARRRFLSDSVRTWQPAPKP